MGIDYNAELGFGVKIKDEELIQKLNEDEIELPKGLDRIWSGDAYSGEMDTYIVIKKSEHSAHSWDDQEDPISPDKLIVKPEWTEQILSWCKEHNITDPKIGWWLCCSVS